MRLRRWKKYGIGAGGMLVLVMAILLATGWGTAVAAQISNVFVTNDASHPVPVHEQGTASVNVTNGSLPVAPQAPISDGSFAQETSCGSPVNVGTLTASALSIHMDDTITFVKLESGGAPNVAARFYGPALGGNASIVLALSRPVTFTQVACGGSGNYSLSTVGNSP